MPSDLVRRAVCLLFLLLLAADSPPSADVTEPPPQEDFLVIPLRIHLLQAEKAPDVHCSLTDVDMERILGKVNGIWHKAGIHFGLESLRREPAENLGKFRLARDLDRDTPASPELFAEILPADSRNFDGLHVYYIHDFNVNGIYMGSDYSLVRETAALRPVAGGIDEPIPRVTAHELGHALGLSHRQDRTNLLASGTTGTILNRREVDLARSNAVKVPGALRLADLRDQAAAAETRGERQESRKLWGWLAEIPGEGADTAREKLKQLAEPSETTP